MEEGLFSITCEVDTNVQSCASSRRTSVFCPWEARDGSPLSHEAWQFHTSNHWLAIKTYGFTIGKSRLITLLAEPTPTRIGTLSHKEPGGTDWRINRRIASGSCSPAEPANVYDRSKPFGPSTRMSQFSLLVVANDGLMLMSRVFRRASPRNGGVCPTATFVLNLFAVE
jgi:hypothetical protein